MINDPNCDANVLNAAGITTIFNAFGTGLRLWGNRMSNFPADKGAFMGLDNLVKQLEKTKVMNQADQLNVFKKLFGTEAGRPAAIIANKGYAGYQDALGKLEKQASLQQRIELSLTTLKNKWDALSGTATNALAAMGEPMANIIGPAIVALNGFVGGPLMDFIARNQQLVGVIGTSVLVIGLLTMALGALGLVAGTTGRFVAGGIDAILGIGTASRFAIGWLAAHRLEIMRLMGVQRAQIALQNMQNAIAYRGGAWQALQYQLMTTRFRVMELAGSSRAWVVSTLTGLRDLATAGWARIVTGWTAMTSAIRALTVASLAWVRVNLLTVAGLRGLAVAGWARIATGWTAMTSAIRALTVASLAWVRVNLFTMAGLRGLALMGWSRIVTGFYGIATAVRAFSMALLANPITWVVTAIAGGAFLIFKYWKPMAAFFSGIWAGITAGIGPLSPAFTNFASKAAAACAPIMGTLQTVWGWLSSITDQAEDTGGAARQLGVSVGQGIAHGLIWVAKLGSAIFSLPGKFYDAGVEMMKGLWRGITSLADKPINAITQLASNLAGGFKSVLGIHSPSRVFMGFGANIGDGVDIGMRQKADSVHQAALALALAGMAGFGQPTLAFLHAHEAPSLTASVMPALTIGAAVGPVQMPSRQGKADAFSAGAGTVTVSFSPVIHVHATEGAGNDVRGQVKSGVSDAYREFESNMKRFIAEQKRGAY